VHGKPRLTRSSSWPQAIVLARAASSEAATQYAGRYRRYFRSMSTCLVVRLRRLTCSEAF
jgi:hypothetical protein